MISYTRDSKLDFKKTEDSSIEKASKSKSPQKSDETQNWNEAIYMANDRTSSLVLTKKEEK